MLSFLFAFLLSYTFVEKKKTEQNVQIFQFYLT